MKKMKISILWALAASLCAFSLIACNEDELSPNSVFQNQTYEETPLDAWLYKNYVQPYNIEFQYRFVDRESDMLYQLVPADYDKAVKMAHLVKHLCFEAYDTVTGSTEFISSYFPKMVFLVGSPAYNNNGSIVLGTAEGGSKITLYNVNILDPTNAESLNSYYFKTIHHEFTHILNQTKLYSTDFDQIVGTTAGIEYVGDDCFSVYTSDNLALADGFISRYSSKSPAEDFAEMVSIYVTNSAASWNSKLTAAGSFGRPIIEAKFDLVRQYMEKEWNIDLDVLRAEVLRRQAEIPTLDLDSVN